MINTINILAFVYQSVPKIGIVLYTALITLLLAMIAVNFIVFKKYDILSAIFLALLIVILFLNSNSKTLFFVVVISLFVISLLLVWQMIYKYICLETSKQKVEEHLRNDTIDFFILMDKKDRILSSSISFAQLTKLSKSEIDKKNGWNLMFEALNVYKINGDEFITSNKELFISHLDEVLSKYKMYEFTLDVKLNEHNELTHYFGYIQAIYLKDKKIGSAVYNN